jgi:hypothetical protein
VHRARELHDEARSRRGRNAAKQRRFQGRAAIPGENGELIFT